MGRLLSMILSMILSMNLCMILCMSQWGLQCMCVWMTASGGKARNERANLGA